MWKLMNKQRQAAVFGIALMLCMCVGCSSKKNDPAPTVNTKTQLLTAADWHASKLEFGSTLNDLVVFPLIPEDARDHYRFTATVSDNFTFLDFVGTSSLQCKS
ncbi:MAG: hypothetical protein ACHQHN_11745 [Sphingobacteriales bacterium]